MILPKRKRVAAKKKKKKPLHEKIRSWVRRRDERERAAVMRLARKEREDERRLKKVDGGYAFGDLTIERAEAQAGRRGGTISFWEIKGGGRTFATCPTLLACRDWIAKLPPRPYRGDVNPRLTIPGDSR